MEEDSPWGAPVSYSPPRPTVLRRLSSARPDSPPPLAATAWGPDSGGGGGGWGDSSTSDEYGGAFETMHPPPRDDDDLDDPDSSSSGPRYRLGRNDSVGDAWGASPSSPSSGRDAAAATEPPRDGDSSADFAPPHGAAAAAPSTASNRDIVKDEHNDDDDRGWTPSTPPLPPIATLALSHAAPSSPGTELEPPRSLVTTTRSAAWEPSSFDDPAFAPRPPPLPSVDDLFPSAGEPPRRESVGDGEEAWGSATTWEVRQQRERERDEREEEATADHDDDDDDVTEAERREIERKVREAEEAAERGEDHWSSGGPPSRSRGSADEASWTPTHDDPHPAAFSSSDSNARPQPPPTTTIATSDAPLSSSLFRTFRQGIQASNESLKTATKGFAAERPPATGMSSIEDANVPAHGGVRGHAGDEFDLDGPGQPGSTSTTKKSSWWGRSGGGDAQRGPENGERGDDRDTVGAEHVEPGGSGKAGVADATAPSQPVGTIGRLFGRFKKSQQPTGNTPDAGTGGDSARSSGDQPRQVAANVEPSWKDEDFDALGSGRLGLPQSSRPLQEEDGHDLDDSGRGFFGDRRAGRGSVKSRSRVPTAPPEDDFGGLLGAFSTAPAQTQAVKPKPTNPYDPFDPLSEPPPPPTSTATAIPPRTATRPVSSFGAPVAPTAAPTGDDTFDAFFDSVTSSIAHRPPALVLPKRSQSTASPVPRMTSPPTPASAGPSRSTTPILPLAPPPPPSQPLAQRNLLGSLAPPPPPPPAAPISRPGSISPAGAGLRPQAKVSPGLHTSGGPLSRDDLSFFENL
ncbi:hypothetical protein JCM11491_003526 [Sporobolomyces phaffii]